MSGGPVLLRAGKATKLPPRDPRHPRTAVGLDREGNVWYVVIDGRQSMSVGASLEETAEVMRRLGCVEAINLDGGEARR
jgi:exopolysaccharide biosynthesis protein